MAKIRIHELAKELNVQNKDILSFLQGKGIEAKAAQSSVEEDVAQLVRRTFGRGAQSASEKPRKDSEINEPERQEPEKKKSEKKELDKKELEKKETVKEEAVKQTKALADAPKKKLIIVSNPQYSEMKDQRQGGNGRRQGGQNSQNGQNRRQGGQNSGQGGSNASQGGQNRPQGAGAQGGGNRGQSANHSQGGVSRAQGAGNRSQGGRGDRGKLQPAAPVRPIKPLTPPSPTPAVQMVPPKPQAKVRPEQTQDRQAKLREADQRKEKEEKLLTETATNEAASGEKAQSEKVSAENTQAEKSQPEKDSGEKAPAEKTQAEKVPAERPQPEKAKNERAAGEKTGERFKGERSQNDRQRSERGLSDRPRGDRNQNSQGRRGQDGRTQDRRTQEGRTQDGRAQGGRTQDGRGRDGRGGYQNQNGGRGGYQSRGDGQNGRTSGDRQNGYQRTGRPGAGNAQGDRRGPGGGQGGGRSFNGAPRDGRGNGGQGAGFRDNKQGKGFAAEAPSKDLEKKREEDKRRASSQEKSKRSRKDHIYEEDEALRNRPGRFIKPEKKKEEAAEEAIKVIILPETITIKDLADKMKQPPAAIIKKLFLEGKIVTLNQEISYEDAENIAMEYDILCEREVKVDVIEELLKEDEEDESALVERPPVICVMGHVDHGKTSLLDTIRKTNVTDKEAGGITQHIGAYTVNVDGRKITFLDTPGHEAFTAMRMRGANSTDIAILVVAADDGVMPQTVEAISHAKAAGTEIIVAVNKIDKPSANIERVKQELTEYELVATDWGGNTEFVPVSAKSGEGIEDLLETILLTADIMELKANPERRARGLVIEAELDKGRGPVATVLVQKGTLHVGDFISAGACYGKVRAMIDDKGRRVKEATPSTPVEILGLSDVPSAGEVFLAHENDKTAKSYAETYLAENRERMLEETKTKMSLDDLFSQIQEGSLKELNLIVKADVQGSVEAVRQSLLKLSNEEVVVKCIHGGVGAINESDVTLASASNAIIIGFNVRPDSTAKATAEREGVDVRLYKVIYQAIEDVEAAMKGMLDPVFEEKVIGHAEIRQIFKASQVGNIAGSYIVDGIFQRGCKVRISREGKQIYEGALASLKRFKDDVKEVKEGFECGLVFEGFDQIQELDIVEAYVMVEVPR